MVLAILQLGLECLKELQQLGERGKGGCIDIMSDGDSSRPNLFRRPPVVALAVHARTTPSAETFRVRARAPELEGLTPTWLHLLKLALSCGGGRLSCIRGKVKGVVRDPCHSSIDGKSGGMSQDVIASGGTG